MDKTSKKHFFVHRELSQMEIHMPWEASQDMQVHVNISHVTMMQSLDFVAM